VNYGVKPHPIFPFVQYDEFFNQHFCIEKICAICLLTFAAGCDIILKLNPEIGGSLSAAMAPQRAEF
jgi:hypothetical protein